MFINLSRRSVYGRPQAVTLCSSCCDTPIDVFMFYNEVNYLSLLHLPVVPLPRASVTVPSALFLTPYHTLRISHIRVAVTTPCWSGPD